jgi:RND family efflux transporter MFP subunit
MLLAACAGACRDRVPAPAATTAAPARERVPEVEPIEVDIERVVERPLDVSLTLPGELTPYQTVDIFARVTGFVEAVRVDRGSHVQTGDILATLEAPELRAQRSEAESKLQAALAEVASLQAKAEADRATHDRLKAASATPGVVAGHDVVLADKTAATSENQVLVNRQKVEAARHAVAVLREMEEYLRVTAPFGGVVTERHVHPGALVGPAGGPGNAAPMLHLVDARRLRLIVPVPEAYTSGLTRGTAVAFTVAAYPAREWTGTIVRVAEAVDVATRTMAVELDVTNAESRRAPGSFCQVHWPVRRQAPSLFVPSGSIAATTDRSFVVRIRDGRAEWVDVKTGLTSGPLIEVFGDLQAGDEVLRRGSDEV